MDEERQGSTEQTGKVIRISGGEAFKPKSRAGDQKELIPGPGTIEWARPAYIKYSPEQARVDHFSLQR